MDSLRESMLALEKINPYTNEYLIYAYVLTSRDDRPMCLYIPLAIASSFDQARAKGEEIIRLTNYDDILIYPMGKWMTLGDSTQEKIIPFEVHDRIKDYAEVEQRRRQDLSKERSRIQKEIRDEQVAIEDPSTLESYYYDWFCLVQDKVHLEALNDQIKSLTQKFETRIESLRIKTQHHPEYRDQWKQIMMNRLKDRNEDDQAKVVVEMSTSIAEEYSL